MPLCPVNQRMPRPSNAAALADPKIGASDLGHVNPHGYGTVPHDRAEAQAIRAVLGETPVTAPKSFFGHLGAGSGAVEMAASVLALVYGAIPVTLNYERPDPECPVNVVCSPAPASSPTAMVLSQATTGQSLAVVLARP